MSITEFLLARIAEDEAVHYPFQPSDWGDFGIPDGGCVPCSVLPARGTCRVQREVKAVRRIVELHYLRPLPAYGGRPSLDWCNCRADWPCPDLLALASVYADHPDFQKEWAI